MEHNLHAHPLFTTSSNLLADDDRILLSYHRARLLLQTWDLSPEDVLKCTPKFWAFQEDPVFALDASVTNILACHVNLFLGTLSPHLRRRPHLESVMERGLKGELIGNFLLSEVGHGLDILNLETTATKVHDGFILHTPHPRAAKIMPPTTPIPGFPKMAVVMARLILDNEERGIHPFLVQTSDERSMRPGITSRRLPPRCGSCPVDFAITSFNKVHLPTTAFLGNRYDKPENVQFLLHRYLWRIGLGTAILPMHVVTGLGVIATIGADYSYRRHIQGKGDSSVPIVSFRTQQLPILRAIALAHVFKAWRPLVVQCLMDVDVDPRVKHAMGVVFKATVGRMTTTLAREVGERLGAQGLFGHNLVAQMENDVRGMNIAEGDILVLSIRLFSEILLERYTLPTPEHSSSLLARHWSGIFTHSATILRSLPQGHRDADFNNLVLPQSEPALIAIGHAYAYAAALDAGVPQPLVDIFELLALQADEGWYIENARWTQARRVETGDKAIRDALPHMKEYVDLLDMRKYFTVPIRSDETWDQWVLKLKSHSHLDEAGHGPAGLNALSSMSSARL
ncbi:hypothetical protein EIP91_000342 [Steccherinum ochraceum]|uniref:Uncharacterized protein n=1 Tax=Steccherinum ochraceum TaxID=92696 RepID=A0A4R0RML7_9APHY|nr:hypothetical protein EIP91_000342 [Steccherinum ochraceum]